MNLDSLPSVLEIKTTLDGRRKEFPCRAIAQPPGGMVLLFISDRQYVVGAPAGYGAAGDSADAAPPALILPSGTVTLGHFWVARPYNVYHWLDPQGRTLAHYFNLARDTRITSARLAWLDLTVDVLVRPGTPPQVLDEHELPANLNPTLQAAIAAARQAVLLEHAGCIATLEAAADRIWPDLFGQARARR